MFWPGICYNGFENDISILQRFKLSLSCSRIFVIRSSVWHPLWRCNFSIWANCWAGSDRLYRRRKHNENKLKSVDDFSMLIKRRKKRPNSASDRKSFHLSSNLNWNLDSTWYQVGQRFGVPRIRSSMFDDNCLPRKNFAHFSFFNFYRSFHGFKADNQEIFIEVQSTSIMQYPWRRHLRNQTAGSP